MDYMLSQNRAPGQPNGTDSQDPTTRLRVTTTNNLQRKITTASGCFSHIDSCPDTRENSDDERPEKHRTCQGSNSESECEPETRERFGTASNSLPEVERLSLQQNRKNLTIQNSNPNDDSSPDQALISKSMSKYFETCTNFGSLKSNSGDSCGSNQGLKNSASICQMASCAITGGHFSTSYAVTTKAAITTQPNLTPKKVKQSNSASKRRKSRDRRRYHEESTSVTTFTTIPASTANPGIATGVQSAPGVVAAHLSDEDFYCCTCDVEALCVYIMTLGCFKSPAECLRCQWATGGGVMNEAGTGAAEAGEEGGVGCCDCGESCYCECGADLCCCQEFGLGL
ncbi:uncharacterized protein LOC142339682 [Convolutriloba macropyga]|uniref:uncharacterized protein LOC142339682 n=1 Tax=Convolutriloba macropyga TaxID=536237 RepID=UPI003F51E923